MTGQTDGRLSESGFPIKPTYTADDLPKNLAEAVTALRGDDSFRAGFGPAFVDYYAHIKAAELERFQKEAGDQQADSVTSWEQREYLDLF